MKTKYTSPIEIAAFKAGLTQGRIEGMLSYQKHLLNQIRKEAKPGMALRNSGFDGITLKKGEKYD